MMDAAVLTDEIVARTRGSGISSATCKAREIEFDTSAGPGETLPGPADLLVTAFAACVLKNVERFSQMLPFRYDAASIRVSAERSASPPRMTALRYELRVVSDEPAQRADLLHRNIRKYGTIYNTLAAVCDIQGTLVVDPPNGGVGQRPAARSGAPHDDGQGNDGQG